MSNTKMAAYAAKTNQELWDLARSQDANFKAITAKGTADLFTERGFNMFKEQGKLNIVNEFFGLSIRIVLNKINVANARNPLADSGIIEVFNEIYGGVLQRIAIEAPKAVSPSWHNLEDGKEYSPFVVRKPKSNERFVRQNYDYQNHISIPEKIARNMFIAETGVSSYISGLVQSLSVAYTAQEAVNVFECLSNALNSTEWPLQESQKVVVTMTDAANPTAEECKNLLLTCKNIGTAMSTAITTGAYNAGGFETAPNPEDHVLLLRAGIKNRMNVELLAGTFNPDYMTLPFKIVEVKNFGGLKPVKAADGTTEVYPAYDKTTGEVIGYNSQKDQTVAEFTDKQVKFVDTNADVIGVIIQKGAIFENITNPYQVDTIFNPRVLQFEYWASSMNNTIAYDPYYDVIKITSK